jgi:hypothetical protein
MDASGFWWWSWFRLSYSSSKFFCASLSTFVIIYVIIVFRLGVISSSQLESYKSIIAAWVEKTSEPESSSNEPPTIIVSLERLYYEVGHATGSAQSQRTAWVLDETSIRYMGKVAMMTGKLVEMTTNYETNALNCTIREKAFIVR